MNGSIMAAVSTARASLTIFSPWCNLKNSLFLNDRILEIKNKPPNHSLSMPLDRSRKKQAQDIHSLNALEGLSFASAFHSFQDN